MSQSSTNIVHDPFASAEEAHGSANPTSFIVRDGHAKLTIQFDRFDTATTRDCEEVETLIGRQRDQSWTSLWLFLAKDGSDTRLREQVTKSGPTSREATSWWSSGSRFARAIGRRGARCAR